jgi:hypothetical protein
MASQVGMTIVHASIAVLYASEQYAAMYTFILIFIVLFNSGSANVTFIILGEICIDKALGVVFAVMWFMEVLMTFTISYMIDSKLGYCIHFRDLRSVEPGFESFRYHHCERNKRQISSAA